MIRDRIGQRLYVAMSTQHEASRARLARSSAVQWTEPRHKANVLVDPHQLEFHSRANIGSQKRRAEHDKANPAHHFPKCSPRANRDQPYPMWGS